jgi:hypothetical protein
MAAPRFILAFALCAAAPQLVACSSSIGDGCSLSSDCSSSGDRICDTNSPGGYCTILGCDYDTCPDEAVCVRFFSVADSNRTCDAQTEDATSGTPTNDCTADEICTLTGTCVPRTAELRYCMKKCSNKGDCRDEYECRDEALMREHGGEPVPPPGEGADQDLQGFCAPAPIQ